MCTTIFNAGIMNYPSGVGAPLIQYADYLNKNIDAITSINLKCGA
jgi:hypothetical protein